MKELIYHRLLLPAVERAPEKVTILDGDYQSTQQEHLDRTCRIAHALRRLESHALPLNAATNRPTQNPWAFLPQFL